MSIKQDLPFFGRKAAASPSNKLIQRPHAKHMTCCISTLPCSRYEMLFIWKEVLSNRLDIRCPMEEPVQLDMHLKTPASEVWMQSQETLVQSGGCRRQLA